MATKESCPQGCTAFYLNTTQCTYTLASTTGEDWMSALCVLAFQKDPGESNKGGLEKGNILNMEDNDLYSSWKTDLTTDANQFQVTVQSTEASRRCKLAGKYLVSLQKEAVNLLDNNSGHIIYSWPYRLLRKFGQVEGGFSIEAGRRCESGKGVFTFLSPHGPLIFQTILERCSVKRRSSVQSHNVNRRSLCDTSLVNIPTTSNRFTDPPVYSFADVPADMQDESDNHYSIVDEASVPNLMHLSFVKPHVSDSNVAVGEEGKDVDEQCHSLENLSLDSDVDDIIYYNLKRATPPLIKKDHFEPEIDDPECIYSDVKTDRCPSDLQLEHFSISFPQPTHQPPPSPLYQTVSYTPLKPRYQRQSPVNDYIPPAYNAQEQAEDDTKEMEEAISGSAHAAPTEAPGSFKHRLAEIISKDLAKFQLPLPPGVGSSTFTQ
ncbi:Docking protein 3 Downstream of tyrosine kinase 3 [Channa argus]|uniref:Docking protein 3 Downstream of tyrosine kinase 3 n=2 Tax=Channa argus TaxID=215402 RepID=A0A6G1PTV6_CHAAH|nr:Docking protein 3 Downstream of tyrosine kinase 3 [Channa argus]